MNVAPELREQEAAVRAAGLGLNMPTFQNGSDMTIAGLNRSYTAESRVAIPQQWEQFVPHVQSIPGLAGTTFYGVCWNTRDGCGFDYLTGAEISGSSQIPASFTSLKIMARRYAVFTHTSHVSALPKTIDTIWSRWAPDCGLKIAAAPCYERYTSEFNPGTGMGGMELWIPLDSDTPRDL